MKNSIEKYYYKIPRVGRHIIFWTLYVSFYSLLYGSFEEDYYRTSLSQLLFLPEKMVAMYFTMYYLMPKYLYKSQYLKFLQFLMLSLLCIGFLHWVTVVYVEHPYIYYADDWGELRLWYPAKIIKVSLYVYPVVAIGVIIKFFQHWYKDKESSQKMAQEKLQAELKFLKAQIHPHFLFNTLNNLYALTLKKSEMAPKVVLMLSDLLNYMLYDCNSDQTHISKEVEMVKNYLELEKIRYGNRLNINFNVHGAVSGQSIAPMVIIPFIENSFKHGVSGETGESWVDIDLSVKEAQFKLKVENSKSELETEDKTQYREGIGLKNVRRRLELLYPGQHELKIFDEQDTYLVVLTLELETTIE